MHKSRALASIGSALLFAGFSAPALAANNNAHIEGIMVGTFQAATESRVNGQNVESEGNAQLYLYGTMAMGPGTWNIEIRGGTSPRDQGVSSFYGSNALVGETLDENGDGRLAITQLFYELSVASGQLRVGLLDPTALLDASSVANDEYTQFLAGAFVNNPAIAFPSFVLGAAYQADISSNLGYKVFVGSDSGLEESDHSYSNVFDIDGQRNGHNKGAFTTVELDWHAHGSMAKAGIWYDTGDVDQIDSNAIETNRYGLYALLGLAAGPGRVVLRAGIANEQAQAAANFVSFAYQQAVQFSGRDTTFGIAIARTGDSSEITYDSEPLYRAEAYWRINIVGSFYVAPDIQYVRHPHFRAGGDDALIAGTRVGLVF